MGVSDLLVTLSGYLITGAVCLLAGAALGYWTAMKDVARNPPAHREQG